MKNLPINIKFLCFADKNENHNRPRVLANQFNQNGYQIYVNERLPKQNLKLKKYCEKKNMLTTTKNCQVRVFTKTNGTFKAKAVNTVQEVQNLVSQAVGKQPRTTNYHQCKPYSS